DPSEVVRGGLKSAGLRERLQAAGNMAMHLVEMALTELAGGEKSKYEKFFGVNSDRKKVLQTYETMRYALADGVKFFNGYTNGSKGVPYCVQHPGGYLASIPGSYQPRNQSQIFVCAIVVTNWFPLSADRPHKFSLAGLVIHEFAHIVDGTIKD